MRTDFPHHGCRLRIRFTPRSGLGERVASPAGRGWIPDRCDTSVLPTVRHYSATGVAGTPGLFQSHSTYKTGTDEVRQARWRSTNGGSSWSGTFISSARELSAPIHSSDCYWGDYNALAADPANGSFFYGWGDGDQGSDWVIRGRAIND